MKSFDTFAHARLGALLLATAACSSPTERLPRGGVEVTIAALNLPGIGVACYDVAVTTATDTVWSRGLPARTLLGHDQTLLADPLGAVVGAADTTTVCSDTFGNADGGDIAYVGPCDASADADTVSGGTVQNTVTVWVDGLYDAGRTTEIGAWQDPCPNGCAIQVDCNPNQDAQARLDLTILRDAGQGFFDVMVNFDDIFCSSKFDTCYPNETETTADDERIELLFGDDQVADWTGVFGFACSGGAGTDTVLAYGEVTVTCTGGATFTIDPAVEPGSNHVATSGADRLHYGVYRGNEGLVCDDPTTGEVVESCAKRYWNLAFDLEDLAGLGTCTLALSATATDDNAGFADGLPVGVGVSYPYIDVDVDLVGCQHNALNDGGGVGTVYHGNIIGLPAPETMCHQYDGATAGAVAGALCGGSSDTAICPCWDAAAIGAIVATAVTIEAEGESNSEMEYTAMSIDGATTDWWGGAGQASFDITEEGGEGGPFCYVDSSTTTIAIQPITSAEEEACRADLATWLDDRCLVDNGGCSAPTPWCFYAGPGEVRCGECTADVDCAGNAHRTVCDIDRNVCILDAASRFQHTANKLDDGRVVMIGGRSWSEFPTDVEVFAADGASFTLADPLPVRRASHTATLLPSGDILVVGGLFESSGGWSLVSDVARFDPTAAPGAQWTSIPGQLPGFYGHAATLLGDGQVLVTGGHQEASPLATAWLFDPATDTWSPAANMADGHRYHTATRLADGRVLVLGANFQNGIRTAVAEAYHPGTNFWMTLGAPPTWSTTYLERHTATLLPDGDVLVAGFDRMARYRPGTNTWTDLTPWTEWRYSHGAVLLGDGRVAFVGGRNLGNNWSSTTELYTPTGGGAVTVMDGIPHARYDHTTTLLDNGTILVLGGYGNRLDVNGHAEVFDPGAAAGAQWSP